MNQRFQSQLQSKIPITKANIKSLLAEEKRKNQQAKKKRQELIMRDNEAANTLQQLARQSQIVWRDICQIRDGGQIRPEVLNLRNQMKEVVLEGIRTNQITNLYLLSQLDTQEVSRFMNLLRDKRNGFEFNFIQTIPFFNYDNESADDTSEMCPICHENFEKGIECIKLQCCHIFHKKCLIKWLIMKRNCPMCKKEVKRANNNNQINQNNPSNINNQNFSLQNERQRQYE